MRVRLRALRAEDGATLVEILVAVVIMGVAFAAIIGGVTTSIMASDMHRKEATAETVLRSYAEAVKAAAYVTCAASYSPAFTPPAGYTASVTKVEYWNGSNDFDATCTLDRGLQRLTLAADASDGKASETLQVVKRTP